MRADTLVKNSAGKTAGFTINGTFITIDEALANRDIIKNLTLNQDGSFISAEPPLPIQTLRQVNEYRYRQITENNCLDREIQHEFSDWKNNHSNYVLYLSGARQIGKTTELQKFAYKNYETVLYVDLSIDQLRESLEKCVQDTLHMTFAFANFCRQNRLLPFEDCPDTIIILDEIQESVLLYNRIRQMPNDLQCHVIVSGSYLGKTINSQYFKPAGSVWNLEMMPLSFAEFCDAFQCRDLLFTIDIFGSDSIKNYTKLYRLYEIYVQIGGYPAVVSEYKKHENIPKCLAVIRQLLQTFTDESAAYFSDDKCRIIFENVYKAAFHMAAHEKKGTSSKDIEKVTNFVKSSSKEHVSRNEVNRAISWLTYSKIIGGCDLYNQGKVSDLLNERRFYFMDCGIANCIAKMTPADNRTVTGMLTENFAYTELYRLYQSDKVKGDKPCCSIYGNYELDFMVVDINDKKYGIEIKTTDDNSPVSLTVYLNQKIVDEGYLAVKTRGGIRKNLYSIPVYAVGCRFPYQ